MNKELISKAKFTDINTLNLDLKQEGNRYRSKIHSSLIFTRTSEGFYIYSWNSRNLKGDIIHFAMNYYNLDFIGAVEHLTSDKFITRAKKNDNHTDQSKLSSQSNSFNFSDLNLSKDMRRTFAYLIKSRLIDSSIIQLLTKNKFLYQDQKGNAVFAIFDEGKNIVGAELNGTLTDKRFKGIASNSNSRYGFNIQLGENPKHLLVFESAIDLLSFWSMYPNLETQRPCILLSLGGLKVEPIINFLSLYSGLELIICIDTDNAANNFIKNNKLEDVKRLYPKGKDWNEYLISSRKKKIEGDLCK
jgi:hypothetical protein